MIRLAPGVFVNSWSDVQVGYLQGKGTYRIFVIRLVDGHTLAVGSPEDITEALNIWNSRVKQLEDTNQMKQSQLLSIFHQWAAWAKKSLSYGFRVLECWVDIDGCMYTYFVFMGRRYMLVSDSVLGMFMLTITYVNGQCFSVCNKSEKVSWLDVLLPWRVIHSKYLVSMELNDV